MKKLFGERAMKGDARSSPPRVRRRKRAALLIALGIAIIPYVFSRAVGERHASEPERPLVLNRPVAAKQAAPGAVRQEPKILE